MDAKELTVYIEREPVKVEIIGQSAAVNEQGDLNQASAAGNFALQNQKNELANLCRVLTGLVENINMYCEQLFSQHREAIAKLAVEIAAKILAKKVGEDDYKIQDIVKSALEKVPAHENIKVHLNPKDCSSIQQLQNSDQPDSFKGITFVSDASVAPAECVIQTPKAIIKSMIDQQLEKICSALENSG